MTRMWRAMCVRFSLPSGSRRASLAAAAQARPARPAAGKPMSAVAFGFPSRALRSRAMERSGAMSGKAGLKAGLAPALEAKAEPEDEQKGEPSRSLEPQLELHFHVRVGGDAGCLRCSTA